MISLVEGKVLPYIRPSLTTRPEMPCLVISLFDQARPHRVLPAGQELARVAFGQPILEGKDGVRMTPPVQSLEAVTVGSYAWATFYVALDSPMPALCNNSSGGLSG